MRPDTYDTIIDTIKELCSYSGWFLLSVLITGCILAIVFLIFYQGLDFEIPIMYLTIVDLVISSLIIAFAFMVQKAKVRFGVEQWRDFWMAFAHPIEIPLEHNQRTELKKWLDENTPRLYRIINGTHHNRNTKIVFRHKTDAMACKLKWI